MINCNPRITIFHRTMTLKVYPIKPILFFLFLSACTTMPAPIQHAGVDGEIICTNQPFDVTTEADKEKKRIWKKENAEPLKHYAEEAYAIVSVCTLPDDKLLVVKSKENEMGADHVFFLLDDRDSLGEEIWQYFPWESHCEPVSVRARNIVLHCRGIDLIDYEKLVPLDPGESKLGTQ